MTDERAVCVAWDAKRDRQCRRLARTTNRHGSPSCWLCAEREYDYATHFSNIDGHTVDWMISYRLERDV